MPAEAAGRSCTHIRHTSAGLGVHQPAQHQSLPFLCCLQGGGLRFRPLVVAPRQACSSHRSSSSSSQQRLAWCLACQGSHPCQLGCRSSMAWCLACQGSRQCKLECRSSTACSDSLGLPCHQRRRACRHRQQARARSTLLRSPGQCRMPSPPRCAHTGSPDARAAKVCFGAVLGRLARRPALCLLG